MERPSNDEIEEAVDVIERLIKYIKETEPGATVTMETLQLGASELAIHTTEEEKE